MTIWNEGEIEYAKNLNYKPPERCLFVIPREIIFEANAGIGDFIRDTGSPTNGIIGIYYSTFSGSEEDAEFITDNEIEFEFQNGSVKRIRYRDLDALNQIIYFEEIDDSFFEDTIVGIRILNVFVPHHKKPRIVKTKSAGSEVYDNFLELHDHDMTYTEDQNTLIKPKANITGFIPGDSTQKTMVKNAGFYGSDGFFRIAITAQFSEAYADGATIESVFWDVQDGNIYQGDEETADIFVEFDIENGIEFRYIFLRVTDSNGTVADMYLPVWSCEPDSPLVLTNFTIASDDRGEGREMSFRFFGDANSVDETIIPKLTPVCYYEKMTGAPTRYISHFNGWTTDEVILPKFYASELTLNVKGIAYWLNEMKGFSQLISPPEIDQPTDKWYLMRNITVDKVAFYILREYTNTMLFCNLFKSNIDIKSPGENLKSEKIWSQILTLMKAFKMGSANADSNNSIWLRRHFTYLDDTEKSSYPTSVDLDPEFWTHENPPSISIKYKDTVSIVSASGSVFIEHYTDDPDYAGEADHENIFYNSQAPGYVGGDSDPGTMEFQRLSEENPQEVLNMLCGNHYSRLNSKYEDITIPLIGNADFVEIAWNEPISVTYEDPNIRGLSWFEKKFLIKKISVQHSNERGQKPKSISWTIEEVTTGGAIAIPIEPIGTSGDDEAITDPGDPPSDGNENLGLITSNGIIAITGDFEKPDSSGGPTYALYNLSENIEGEVLQFCLDPNNTDNGIIVTTTHIYSITGLYTSRTVLEVFEFRLEEELRSLDISFLDGKGVVTTSYEDGCYRTYSNDLETWDEEVLYGATAQIIGTEWMAVQDFTAESGSGLNTTYGQNDYDVMDEDSAGEYIENSGWEETADPNDDSNKIRIRNETFTADELTFIQAEYEMAVGEGDNAPPADGVVLRVLFEGSLVAEQVEQSVTGINQTISIDGLSDAVDEIEIEMIASVDSGTTETYIGQVQVPVTNAAVFSAVLINGQLYRFEISRIYQSGRFAGSTTQWSDAFYDCAVATAGASGNGTWSGRVASNNIRIDGVFPTTQAFQSNHTYSVSYTGDGTSCSFQLSGGVSTGAAGHHLLVKIYQVDSGGGDGGGGTIRLKRVRLEGIGGNSMVSPSPEPFTNPPGCYVSNRLEDKVFTSGYDEFNEAFEGYFSLNDSVTLGSINGDVGIPDINPVDNLCAEIHVPFDSNPLDMIVYHGAIEGEARRLYVISADGMTRTNISPNIGDTYGPWLTRNQIVTSPVNKQIIAFAAANGSKSHAGIWTSTNGGLNWINLITPSTDGDNGRYHRIHIAPDGSQRLYLWGTKGKIGFTSNFGVFPDDRRGTLKNISDLGEVIGIFYK